MLPESKSVTMKLAASASSAGVVFGSIDTKGFSFLTIDLHVGTVAAAETAVTTLRLGESDTAPTNVTTDCDAIVALTGAAATSTSAGFVLPPASSTTTNIYRFSVNLVGRKRYIGCEFIAAAQIAAGVAMVGHLSRPEVTPVMAAIGTATAGCRLVVAA